MRGKIPAIITALAVSAFVPLALAQQAGKVYRIGYLGPNRVNPAFVEGLRNLGYVKGKNLTLIFLRAKRNKDYPALAKELVARKVDLLLSVGISATHAAQQATGTIPIVMGNSSANPVRLGLIKSLARPGGNVTGVIDLLPDLADKRLEVLKEIFPKLARVFQLSTEPSGVGREHFKVMQAAARALGVQVESLTVKRPTDLDAAFRTAVEAHADAAVIIGTGFFIRYRKRIVDLSARYGLPTMHTHQGWVRQGGLVSYTTNSGARYRRAAWYVDRIFKGARPADLPVERPTKFELAVNLKTARALGITFPRSILIRADKVIE